MEVYTQGNGLKASSYARYRQSLLQAVIRLLLELSGCTALISADGRVLALTAN
jgi:hypothetical protein